VKSTQNITLALPKDTLKRVRLIAVERGTSVSGLLAETLASLVEEEDSYEQAHRRYLALLETDFDLGTGGEITWSRESLHER
jgi:hypothetical protein